MDDYMTADLPEKARVRWDAILQEAEKKKTGLSDELRRQLPKLVEETAEEAAKVRYKPYLYSELFWYHLQRRAWFIIYGYSEQSRLAFYKRWEWSNADQCAQQYAKPGCYQYMDAFFGIRARLLGTTRPTRRKEVTGHTDDGGPLCIIDDLQAALEEVASPNNAYGEPANSAVQVWTPALGKELPVWQDWPSAEDRRSVANRIFPARHPDHGLGYFEFPAPPQEHWVCCFGAAGWEEMRTCLLSAAADLGGCYGASYPLRVALQLRGSSGPDAWTGVMRFGWDAVNVKPLHPHFQAMIKFAYETLMKWHLTVLNGQMVALDKWTSEALALQIRRPDAIWGEIEHFRARLKLQQQTELAEREKRDSLRIEKEVFTVDEDHARLLAEENFEYIRHWAERCIDEQRGKAMPGPEARDWLIRWVHEGVDWRLFPFKEIIYSSVRMEVADKFAVEVMATCAKELWKDYAVGEQVEVLAARDLDGLALSEFYAWIRFNPEDNQWCGLLASRTRGRIMLEAFDDLAVQAAMDYPDNEAVHMALRDERVGLLEAVDDAVAAERRDQLGTPEPEIEFE